MVNRKLMAGLVVALLVAIVLSPYASPNPDGLERVAEDHNFIDRASEQGILSAPVPDYVMPGIKNEAVATGLAGACGVLLTFGVMLALKKLLVKSSS